MLVRTADSPAPPVETIPLIETAPKFVVFEVAEYEVPTKPPVPSFPVTGPLEFDDVTTLVDLEFIGSPVVTAPLIVTKSFTFVRFEVVVA